MTDKRITLERNPDGSYNLLIEGVVYIDSESYAIVDQVREAMYGHRAGVTGECLEVADTLLTRLTE